MRLRVFNVTQATVVSPDVVLIDTAREPFNALARGLKFIADRGIWLSPYRGVPQIAGIPPLDIVYLDSTLRTIGIDLRCNRTSIQMDALGAESALVLPAGSAVDSRMQIGDKVRFCDSVTGLLWAKGLAEAETEAPSPTVRADTEPIAQRENSAQLRQPMPERELRNAIVPPPTFKHGVVKKTLAWLFDVKPPADRRRGVRREIPELVAYFWTGGPPKAYEVANISTEGFYLRTEERWIQGTTLLVSMQLGEPGSERQPMVISVQSKVVRTGADGVGFEYDTSGSDDRRREFGVSNPEETIQLRRLMEYLKE